VGYGMNSREEAWERILEQDELVAWLQRNGQKSFQLHSKHFKDVGQRPVRMIPSYGSSDLPAAFTTRGLELFRNLRGGCLLLKTKEAGLPTLFPDLPEISDQYTGPPFQPIPKLTALMKPKSSIVNEETGIHLAWSMGVISSFLMDCFSPHEEFSSMGRMKTMAKGEVRVLDQNQPVKALVEVDGYFESDENIVVLEAKMSPSTGRLNDFSIHQIVLPLMLVRSESEKPSSGILLDWSFEEDTPEICLSFRLYHYSIPGRSPSINPFDYSLDRAKEYMITL
jgi:hypothetical protein